MVQLEDTGERLVPELHKQSLAYGEHLARYRAAEGLVKGKVVLDIASGAGYGTAFLAQKAQKVIGVDYDETAITYSKKFYPLGNVEFIVGDAQKLPLKDASVDVVVSLETIEHIPKPEKFVQEVVRVLKPDGVFYVSTPNDDEFVEGNEFHLHEFNFVQLSKLIDKYFKQAQYYFQGTWYASGVLNKANFEQESTPIAALKTFTQPTEKAIYYLAVSTNSRKSVPGLTENVVVADRFSELSAQRQHIQLVKLDESKEEHIRELTSENGSLKAELFRIGNELSGILNSKGWKVMKKLYTVKAKFTSSKPTRNK